MQTCMHHLVDQQATNHRCQIQLNDSFYHYTLHQHSQDLNPYPWPTLKQFRVTIAWPGGRPIFLEDVGLADDQGEGRPDEDEYITNPVNDYIGGNNEDND